MKTFSRFSLLVVMLLLGTTALTTFAGEPIKPLPAIGLTRVTTQRVPNNKLSTYPNSKILVAGAASGGRRFVLIPVTVANCWDSVPIYSFQFSVEYDQQVLQAVSVQKTGPAPLQNLGLAKDFHLTYHDTIDTRPQSGVGVFTRQITISGSSSTPLPLTTPPGNDCRSADTVDLLYILFEVKAHAGQVPSASLLRIPNDTLSLFWNDYTPANLFPTSQLLNRDIGLCGPDSLDATGSVSFGTNNNISGRGRANLVVTKQPGIDLSFADADVVKYDDYNYTFTDVFYADSNSTDPRFKLLDIIDSVADTRIVNLTLCSNEPWLTIGNNPVSGSRCYTLSPDLDYTSNALLRSQSVYIIADPNYFATQNLPDYTSGVYTGVITFTSDEAGNSPTKLYVTFIYQRNPVEPSGNPLDTRVNSGIHLLVQDSKAVPDSAVMTFGTGVGASDGVDSLFGERYQNGIPGAGAFYARWFPPSNDPNLASGLGDVGDVHTFMGSHGVSRDIRSYRTDSTIEYLCHFSVGNVNNYPVVLYWDANEFPPGSRLMLRDTLNGSRFSVDMRKSTGTSPQSFTIRDRDITSFVIEYTPGSVAVTPGIVRGWNLVSLPVVAPDPRISTVFPNALNNHTAYLFFQSDYQQVDAMDFGRGYFVKWGNIITQADSEVSGVKKLSLSANDGVTINDGWNSIGSLSAPMSSTSLQVAQRGNTTPKLASMVYAYDNNRGYRESSIIYPGRGYWVNVSGDAYLTVPSILPPAIEENGGSAVGKDAAELNVLLNDLTVRDNAQREGEAYFGTTAKKIDLDRYALPPVPPAGAFDVRFTTDRSVESNVNATGSVLKFQTADYPVVLSATNVHGNYVVADLNGKTLGEFVNGQDGEITITNHSVRAVKIMAKSATTAVSTLPTTEDLSQNFPNPFNPTTEFFYSVPTDEFVTVKVVNALGQDVMTLVNQNIQAGTYKVQVDASKLPSGIYYYKMTAGNFSATRKMILTK